MSSERFAKAGDLFDSALAMPPENRSAYLKEACGEDQLLLAEVESLLTAHQQAKGFMQSPAFKNVDLTPPEDHLSEGQQVGAYRIVRQIGRGGMGTVYLAERADEHFKKYVAVKLVKRGMDTDYILRHFRNERQILANFDHPNIARLLDGGSTEGGLPYFVMEYVEGKPIDQYCDENKLSITHRLELFQQVCAAVAYAHRNLVIHRDIKPSNILVTSGGVPKLLDFGIAKIMQTDETGITATAIHVMTPEFASPEQAQGQSVTTLSDVYSLGVVLYELLTGYSPYELKSRAPVEIARIITETQPVLPSTKVVDGLQKRLRGDLDNIVLMALRKEPHRRYQSVEQLSADISRHLEGLPVQARKDTFGYRASKFIQRNKIAVAIALFAFLGILISAGIAGFIQWRANRQAKFLQEFGQEVARIEGTMRIAHLLPLHDIQPEKKQVVQSLDRLQKEMENLGTVAYGPGHYSLGRGYLALQQYQTAYEHLFKAWNDYEYRIPAVEYSLGYSLAMLYHEKLKEAAQTIGKSQLSYKKEQLKKTYRDPALQYIRSSHFTSEAAQYVAALLAFFSKDYTDSLKYSDETIKKFPAFYEAQTLQGDIYKAIGDERRDTGKLMEAETFYSKAKEAYLAAAKKGQSDPNIYIGLCALQNGIIRMQAHQTENSPEATYNAAISYCDSALKADAENVSALLTTASTHFEWAYYQRDHGKDITEIMNKAIHDSKSAIHFDPQNPSTHLSLGNAYLNLAEDLVKKQRDPTFHLNLAEKSLELVISKSPEDASAYFSQGNAFFLRARYEKIIGTDPRTSIKKAISAFSKAIDQDPKNPEYYNRLGGAYWRIAEYETHNGLNPTKSLESALNEYRKALKINPMLVDAHGSIARCNTYLAEWKMASGEDPVSSFDSSVSAFESALRINQNDPYALAGIGYAQWKKGEYLYSKRKDPSFALQSARESLQKAVQSNKNIMECYAIHAYVEQIAARYAIDQKSDPSAFFQNSQKLLNTALSMNSKAFESWGGLASLCLIRANYLHSLGKPVGTEINKGIHAADLALAEGWEDPDTLGVRGGLFLLLAQTSNGDAQIKAATKAEQSYTSAIKGKSSLRNVYKSDLEEAQRMIKSPN